MVIISNAQGENKQSRGENKMANGCYDIDGRCVNCKEYHPCKCEDESNDRKEKERCNQCGQTSHEDSFGHCPEASSRNSEPEWDDGNQQDER